MKRRIMPTDGSSVLHRMLGLSKRIFFGWFLVALGLFGAKRIFFLHLAARFRRRVSATKGIFLLFGCATPERIHILSWLCLLPWALLLNLGFDPSGTGSGTYVNRGLDRTNFA